MAITHLHVSDNLNRECTRQMFTVQILLQLSYKHILISLTIFMLVPNSVRMLYSTPLHEAYKYEGVPKVSGLAVWSENCELYSSLQLHRYL
jgi:hypothetical protein